jgi:hypothetical protein
MKKYLIMLWIFLLAPTAFATDPNEMAHQCEQYGSYQNAEGVWIPCEYEESPEASEEEEFDTEEDSSEYQEESND